MIKIVKYPSPEEWGRLLKRQVIPGESLAAITQEVFRRVQNGGDEAVSYYTNKFDQVSLSEFSIPENVIDAAVEQIDPELLKAMELAKQNIERFHETQIEPIKPVETSRGVVCWRENRPIESVGLYIPGGSAPLFSTVLMLGIPARLAGCKNRLLFTPPGQDGLVHPAILAAARLAGITKVFAVGGIQAVAAMTFGTEQIPRVDKIFGPGNQYVTQAKMFAQQQGVAIDMPAGPSEVLVIADRNADPAFVAADLLSQAEHGSDSQAVLLTDNIELAEKVAAELTRQVVDLPRQSETMSALNGSRMLVLRSMADCVACSNNYAPEHLILAVENAEQLIPAIVNAGSVFVGRYSCESAGDYASGTNHTLPTNGYARNYSGVSVDSFVKKVTFQKLSAEGLMEIGPSVVTMAEAEGLRAHANAINVRMKKLKIRNSTQND